MGINQDEYIDISISMSIHLHEYKFSVSFPRRILFED